MPKYKTLFRCATLFLCVLLLIMSTSCNSSPTAKAAQIELCVDLTDIGYSAPDIQNAVKNLAADIRLQGFAEEVSVRCVPAENPERDMEIQRLKTEIMAGSGPDIFLIGHGREVDTMLFPSPEKSMQSSLFLPLDSYLDNTATIDRERFLSVVWDAGKWEGKQYILPLTYTFPATVFRSDDMSFDGPMTWREMVENPDLNLKAAASWVRSGSSFGNQFISGFERILDEKGESVKLSERELKEQMELALALTNQEREGELSGAKPHFQVNMSISFNTYQQNGAAEDYFNGITPQDNVTFVPIFNSAGGVSASVVSYVAINAATENPDEAFHIADYLLNQSSQRGQLFQMLTETASLPMDNSLLVPGNSMPSWDITEGTYEEFCRVQSLISYARLPSHLNSLFSEAYWDCYDCYFDYDDGDMNTILSDYYRSLQMFAGES